MDQISRRTFSFGLGGALLVTAACNNGVGSNGAAVVDGRVDATLDFLYGKYPGAQDVASKSVGMLVMPLITKAGFGIGGSFGRGALRVGGVSVDYYSATQASVGLQIGAQQYSHVLFFMTDEALSEFRRSYGWVAGGDIEYAFNDQGGNLSATTVTTNAPVIGAVFGQAGLIVGATVQGTKYNRIIP